jgi:pyruvate/2-oxoglutarate/acetoin dehydrogenase E1 component
VHDSLAAAERLASEHAIEAEVIDLRTLRPVDIGTIRASIAGTNRLLILEEGPLTGGWAGEVLSLIVEQSLEDIDDAWRLATPDLPIPYSPPLEDAHLPGVDAIVASVADRLR